MDDSLMINGTWINKRTGETIVIVNSIIDGDEMYLMTNKGQLSMAEFSQDYMQVSDEVYDDHGKVIGKEKVNANDFVVHNTPIDMNAQINFNDFTDDIKTVVPERQKKQKEPESYKILDKFFAKIENKESLVKIDIDFDILPKEKLQTIIDFMDISTKDLSSYIADKLVDKDILPKIIENKVLSWTQN